MSINEDLKELSDEEPSLRKIDKKLSVALIYLTQHEEKINCLQTEIKNTKDGVVKWAWGILTSVIVGVVTLITKKVM